MCGIPCLISALLIPTLATPLTAPELERVATAVPPEGTTAPPVGARAAGCVCVCVCVMGVTAGCNRFMVEQELVIFRI